MNIVQTICKLEMIFPLFFDLIEHLLMHLLFKSIAEGPFQHRWMYQFERLMITHAS
jgi:hypothetical protein